MSKIFRLLTAAESHGDAPTVAADRAPRDRLTA